MRAQLGAIEAGGERIGALDHELEAARSRYSKLAAALSAQRREAATRLDAAVASELVPLKLDAARFRTAIDAAEPSASGTDRVEFEVSTNPGAPFGPLTKIGPLMIATLFALAILDER